MFGIPTYFFLPTCRFCQGTGVQSQEQAQQGNAAVVPGRPLLQHCHSETKGWNNRPQEVYRPPEKGEGGV